MGWFEELDCRIRGGGDDAVAAARELSGITKQFQAYETIMRPDDDITDIVTVLRGLQFSCISPDADDSASMLHYCVAHAADEIEALRAAGKSSWNSSMNGDEDITSRLRRWCRDIKAVPASDIMDEAASVIDSLRLEVRILRSESQQ